MWNRALGRAEVKMEMTRLKKSLLLKKPDSKTFHDITACS
jgi:hypothetical protein